MENTELIEKLEYISAQMAGWMKFLGIINIIVGALTALTLVGILVAWLPIWIGILLYQAGSRAQESHFLGNPERLVEMLFKLKTYFIIQGVLTLIAISFWIIAIFVAGVSTLPFRHMLY